MCQPLCNLTCQHNCLYPSLTNRFPRLHFHDMNNSLTMYILNVLRGVWKHLNSNLNVIFAWYSSIIVDAFRFMRTVNCCSQSFILLTHTCARALFSSFTLHFMASGEIYVYTFEYSTLNIINFNYSLCSESYFCQILHLFRALFYHVNDSPTGKYLSKLVL